MLKDFELLKYLDKEKMQIVEKACTLRTYQPEEWLIREGDRSTDIYFLVSGDVDLYKWEESSQTNLLFKKLSSGQSFGEMSFIEGSPRSCSVRARNELTVYILEKEKLFIDRDCGINILSKMTAAINRQVINNLKYLDDSHASLLQKKIDDLEQRHQFASFLFLMVSCLFLIALVRAITDDFFPDYNLFSSVMMTWIYFLFVLLIPLFIGFKGIKLSLHRIGIKTEKLKESLVDALLFGGLGTILIWGTAKVVNWLYPELGLTGNPFYVKFPLITAIYFVFSYVQEFVRGAVQVTVEDFLGDRHPLYAIFFTSFIFGICHLQYGAITIIVTFFASIIFGIIYSRTYNLFGVGLVHFILGAVVINLGIIS